MREDTRLVFVDGKLILEGRDFTWVNGRLLFKTAIEPGSLDVTVVYLTGCVFVYGKNGRDINLVLDPAQKLVGE